MMSEHPDLNLPYENRAKPMFLLVNMDVDDGRVKTKNFVHYARGHHFLRAKDSKVVDNMVEFADKFRAAASQCNGRYHFGKNDLITTYIKCLEEKYGKEHTQSEGRIFD